MRLRKRSSIPQCCVAKSNDLVASLDFQHHTAQRSKLVANVVVTNRQGVCSRWVKILLTFVMMSSPKGILAEVLQVKECAAGEYLLQERGLCAICPAGTYGAVSGLTSPGCSGLCEPGYYCPEGSTSARQFSCPAGTYGSSYGLRDDSCSGPAMEGYYTTTASTRPDRFECSTMENLYYCPAGSAIPHRVQLGYHTTGGTSNNTRTSQEICQPGHYCPDSLGIMLTCPPGVYGGIYGLHTASCEVTCGKGQYCPEASTEPLLCPAGTYNNETGKSSLSDCLMCPLGHYCVQESHVPVMCPAGQYGDQEGLESSSCSTRCTSISSMDDPNDVANVICVASQCEEGYFCPEGSVSSQQEECGDAQLYCPASSSIPVPVDEGYYTIGVLGNDNPLNTTQVAQTLCEPGNYCVAGAKYTCPAGYYGDSYGLNTNECSGLCSPGYICAAGSTDSRATQCGNSTVYCPQGSFEVVAVTAGYYTVGYECPTTVVEFLRLSGDFPGDNVGDDENVDEDGIRTLVMTFAVNYEIVESQDDYDALSSDEVLDMLIENRDIWNVNCIPDYDAERKGGSGPRTRAGEHPCEPGYFCVFGTRFKCFAGTYMGDYSASVCLTCPEGHYCPEQSTEPTPCPCGTYGQTAGLKDEGCSGICPAGYYCEEGHVDALTNPCGSEKVFCPLGSCEPTTVKPAYYAIGGSSRITRTAQQKCDVTNHLQRQCPLGTVNSDFECYASDLLTDEWYTDFATGTGRVNGSADDQTNADFDTGVYVGCSHGYIQSGNDVYVHCEEEDTFITYSNKSTPTCDRVSCILEDVLSFWNNSVEYTTHPLPQDIYVWWGETVNIMCADGYYDFQHANSLELECDYSQLQNMTIADVASVTCEAMYCDIRELFVGLWEWGYVASKLEAQKLIQIPVPVTLAASDLVILSSEVCTDEDGESVAYVAVDGITAHNESSVCEGLVATNDGTEEFANFEISTDSIYVHSLLIFVDSVALDEFEVWISDDPDLMTTAYDSTGGSHVVCAGPDSVQGLTEYQKQAIETDVEVVCNSNGRFVRIQLLGSPRALVLREVEFYTGTFEDAAFSDTVGFESIVAATCDDRFSPIDNEFPSQVVECVVQFESFEQFDDSQKATFCTINYCEVNDLLEYGAPMYEGHSISSASSVLAIGDVVSVTCEDGYWPYDTIDSAHYHAYDDFGLGTWLTSQFEPFLVTCEPPMGFFNYSGLVCAPIQCEPTDLLDGLWAAENGFAVSSGDTYQRSTAPTMPPTNLSQFVYIICDPNTHRMTDTSASSPSYECITPFSYIAEIVGFNDTDRVKTGFECEPIECAISDLLSDHWRAGYSTSPVSLSPLFDRSSNSVMGLLQVDEITCDEENGYFALGDPSPQVTCTHTDPYFTDYGNERREFWCGHSVSCEPADLLTGTWATGYSANYDTTVYLGSVVSIVCDTENGYSMTSGPSSGALEFECASSVSFTTLSPAERNSLICAQ